jgi:hypothetical protein
MSDKLKILVGLVVLLVLLTFPFWHTLTAAGDELAAPELVLPAGQTRCVEDAVWMAGNHMTLLDQWRNAVVRDGERTYRSFSFPDQEVVMSLTGTCLDCHDDQAVFCDRCHDYADITPTCMDCHLEQGGN